MTLIGVDRRWLAPIAVLLLGVAGLVVFLVARPRGRPQLPERAPLLVRAVPVALGDERLVVRAEGTVRARTESELLAEVAGRVRWISPALRPGGFFEDREPLLRLDARDYEIALTRARAALARAEGERDLAERTLERQTGLRARGATPEAALEDAEARLRVARADVLSARAALEQAERDLDRTELRAPFAGRVLEQTVDLGQFVGRGASVARVYAIDTVEVRLPIADDELAFLDLPLDYRGETPQAAGPAVLLRARFAGHEHTWRGRIARLEGQIDPRSRMVHVVAVVADPYGRGDDPERPPLAVGLFVSAEIEGRTVRDVAVLPREALRAGDRVLVVDGGRLRFRDIDVLRRERERVIVRSGLRAGEVVCVSPLETVVEGMRVRVYDSDGAGERS